MALSFLHLMMRRLLGILLGRFLKTYRALGFAEVAIES